ncbi:MAG: hypothetical protein IPL59_26660 [Candidatus Competibacteraceae bacterium]|nr:hypothetical protein [Candidatus Competibacteraceae bacterium]
MFDYGRPASILLAVLVDRLPGDYPPVSKFTPGPRPLQLRFKRHHEYRQPSLDRQGRLLHFPDRGRAESP